jgi:FAD/FMN-containing dehydrogenase
MVPQGGNTGYCGGATPDASGTQVVINLSRMNRIRRIDERALTLSADAGVVLAAAQQAAAERDLLLPLAMGSQGSCQLGGNISTNAGGLAVLRYGTARELVAGLEVVLPDGRLWSDMAGLRKDNTGYDLKQLYVGAEGTLGIISGVMLRLHARPRAQITAWLGIDSVDVALDLLHLLRAELGDCITSIEYLARDALNLVIHNVDACVDPLPEFDGDSALVEIAAFADAHVLQENVEKVLADALASGRLRNAVLAQNETQRRQFWHIRESLPAAEKHAGGSIKHDISVPLGMLGSFASRCRAEIVSAFPGSRLSLYGHVGDGNLHCNVLAPLNVAPETFKRTFGDDVSRFIHHLAAEFSGSFSAEHGIGQLKRELLAATATPVALDLMRRLKSALDPRGLMNPGKVL